MERHHIPEGRAPHLFFLPNPHLTTLGDLHKTPTPTLLPTPVTAPPCTACLALAWAWSLDPGHTLEPRWPSIVVLPTGCWGQKKEQEPNNNRRSGGRVRRGGSNDRSRARCY